MKKTYAGSCHCGAVRFEADIDLAQGAFKKIIHHRFCAQCGVRSFAQASDPKGNEIRAVRVNCLDGVDPKALIDAPLKFFDMLHDDVKSPPAATRHL